MKKTCLALLWLLALLLLPACALGDTHALLIACSDFISQPDLGSAISGNLHMLGSALISSDMPMGNLSIEDGTIGTVQAFESAVTDAFSQSDEDDLSILYLCTHGVLSSADDEQVYLLLGDGENETPLSATQLYELMQPIQGEKLLILDACYSGALIGRGMPDPIRLPGSRERAPDVISPFMRDASIHVLTSANGRESSWYYDSDGLSTGAVSYFASALSCGLGLYGAPEADMNGDGGVTLAELHRYLNIAVPSSSSQLLSTNADSLRLPVAENAMINRPLSGFSYSSTLLAADDPTLDFSFTVTREGIGVQYRLIEYENGQWDWANAQTFLDAGEQEGGLLTLGRKYRSLLLSDILPDDSGYLMLQIFSVTQSSIQLCSERLVAVQPTECDVQLTLSCPDTLPNPGLQELPVDVHLNVPAELTVSITDGQGNLVRRLASVQLTRPSLENVSHLYWDGRDARGEPVPDGQYTLTAETRIGSARYKASAGVSVGL